MQGLEWIVIFYTNYITLKLDCKSCYLYLEPSSPSVFETQDNGTTILNRIAMSKVDISSTGTWDVLCQNVSSKYNLSDTKYAASGS